MAISECPVCTCHIADAAGMTEGEVMRCPDCGARLRLAKNFPPVFEVAGED